MLLADLLANAGLITEGKKDFLYRKRRDYEREITRKNPDPKKVKDLKELIGIYNKDTKEYEVI